LKPSIQSWRQAASPLLAGAANALAFAPGPLPGPMLPLVQLACLAYLAYLALSAPDARRAAWAGFLFGLGTFAVGQYWIFISLHRYGGLASPLAAGAVLLLAAAESLYFAAAAALAHWLAARPGAARAGYGRCLLTAAVWASCWTLGEWLRGTLFTGFPWQNIGYAHVEGMLAAWAPLFGVYGVAWLAAFACAAVGQLAVAQGSGNEAPPAATVAAAIVIVLAGLALRHVEWSQPQGQPFIARLVQGNVPQSEKFDPALMQQGLDTYMSLAALPAKEAGADPALIILPETIMVLFQDRYAPQVWRQWLEIAGRRQAILLMGVPLHTAVGGAERFTNSAIAFSGDTPLQQLLAGAPALRYDKHHLVPFGEFVPPGFRWFVDALDIPLGDFDRGAPRQRPFQLAGQALAPDICFEDVFGEEIIRAVRPDAQNGPGASVLVNISNLGWFGNTWALRQHLQISRMRALETARPMIRATNTGMTAAIAPDGSLRATLPPAAKGVLDVEVQGASGLTPYVRWGNTPVLAWSLLLLLAGLVSRRRAHIAPRHGAGHLHAEKK